MDKKKIMKLVVMICVILTTTIFILSYQFKKNEIEKNELMYGKQDLLITKVDCLENIDLKNVEKKAISKEYPEIEINKINGKDVYGVALVDVDKNYFDIHSYLNDKNSLKTDTVVIGERLANYLDVTKGDNIKFSINNSSKIYKISDVVNNKVYMDNEDKIFVVKDKITFNLRTNVSVILKNIDRESSILKNNAKYKIHRNDSLIKSKKDFLDLKARSIYIVFFAVLMLSSTLILNIIFDKKERNIIGVKRILGESSSNLMKTYISDYLRLSVFYGVVSILAGVVISQLLSIMLLNRVFFSRRDILFLILIYITTIFIVYFIQKMYIRIILKDAPVDIIDDKKNKNDKGYRFYFKVDSKAKIFWRYYQIDLLKNIFIVFVISVASVYFFKTNYTYYLDQTVYQQHKKFEGNDFDFKISVNGTINTNKGISRDLYNEIRRDKNIEHINGSRYSYGFVSIDPKVNYDKKYFASISNASGYMKNILNGVIFQDNSNTYIKSEIVGIDENYLSQVNNYIGEGKVSKNSMDKDSIILYIPKVGEDNKYKVQYKIGDSIDIYMPVNGASSEAYFRSNKIDENMIKKRFKIIAILEKPTITSDYYTGDTSLVPIMSVVNFDKIVNNSIYRDIKIKYKNSISEEQKKIYFSKLCNKVNMPGVSITSYLEERNKDFEALNQSVKLKNIISILIILLGILLTSVNLLISINKRKKEYALLNIVGLSNKKIESYIFIENFINYILAAIIVLIFSVIVQKKIFNGYAEVLMNNNINTGIYFILSISITILVLGLIDIVLFKFIALKYKKMKSCIKGF